MFPRAKPLEPDQGFPELISRGKIRRLERELALPAPNSDWSLYLIAIVDPPD